MKKLIINVLISISIVLLLAYFLCDIQPATEYGWLAGIWHGMMLMPNFFLHWFNSDILYYSDMPTTAYKIFFGVGVLLDCLIGNCVNIIYRALNSEE